MPLTAREALRTALRTRLEALTGVPLVLYQGDIKDPPAATLHVRERVTLAPNAEPIAFGAGVVHQELRAQYVLEVFAPSTKLGTAQSVANALPLRVAESWADRLGAHFPVGHQMIVEDREFQVRRSSTGTAANVGAEWVSCPVLVDVYHEYTSLT